MTKRILIAVVAVALTAGVSSSASAGPRRVAPRHYSRPTVSYYHPRSTYYSHRYYSPRYYGHNGGYNGGHNGGYYRGYNGGHYGGSQFGVHGRNFSFTFGH